MLGEDGGQELVALEWSESDWWLRPDAEQVFKKGRQGEQRRCPDANADACRPLHGLLHGARTPVG